MMDHLKATDPKIFDSIVAEARRQGDGLELIASENFVSRAVMEAMGWFVLIPGVIHAHQLWHVAVLIGALFHWWFVWNVVRDDVAGLHQPGE